MRRRRKEPPIGGDTSELGARFIGIAIVAVAAGVGVILLRSTAHHVWSIAVLFAGVIVVLILFGGNERVARPLMIILRPGIWVVRKLMDTLELLGLYRG